MSSSMFFFVLLLIVNIIFAFAIYIALTKKINSSENNKVLKEELREVKEEMLTGFKMNREELSSNLKNSLDTIVKTLSEINKLQREELENIVNRLKVFEDSNLERIEKMRNTIDRQLDKILENNEKKLEQMRQTVDEKLQGTLEKRLGESFKLVSTQLEAVQKGLGEMQNLATGVGDLKKVLTNVKARGTWGEVQLGSILEQILAPGQYEQNVKVNEKTNDIVEYAICLPGTNDETIYLPIDAKFPQESYLRLLDAIDRVDTVAVQKTTKELLDAVRKSAKDISDKYINPPFTTDFAIMFLPTEGLYAEVLRTPGVVEEIQRNYRVVISGPTTVSAILNSMRLGFKTLALQKQAGEVWKVLGAVKTEFNKFGDLLAKVKKQITTVGNTIEQTEAKTRTMLRKLKNVEQLPNESAEEVLEVKDNDDIFLLTQGEKNK